METWTEPLEPLDREVLHGLLEDARALERFQRGVGTVVTLTCAAVPVIGGLLAPFSWQGVLCGLGLASLWGLAWWFGLHAEDRQRVADLRRDLRDARIRVTRTRVLPRRPRGSGRAWRIELEGLGPRALGPVEAARCVPGTLVELREAPRSGEVLGLTTCRAIARSESGRTGP